MMMKFEIERMKYEADDLRRRRLSASGRDETLRSEAIFAATSVYENENYNRKNAIPTPTE